MGYFGSRPSAKGHGSNQSSDAELAFRGNRVISLISLRVSELAE